MNLCFLQIKRGGKRVKLDFQFTQLLKGLSCIVIALHHYPYEVLPEGFFKNLFYWAFTTQGGYAGVALFFFLSGFGLMESESKHHLNLFQFVTKRFWKIYKGILIINLITLGSIACWTLFKTGDWGYFDLSSLFSITAIDYHLWFIKVLFCCYIGFALSAQIKNSRIRNNAFLLGQVLVFSFLLIIGEASNHLVSIPLFAAGIFVSLYKEKTAMLVRNFWTWLILLFSVLLVIYWSYVIKDMMPIHAVFNICMIMGLLWITTVFDINTNYTSFLGYISFPVYLVHGKILSLSSGLGHVAPVLVFLGLTIYLGWLLQKTIEVSIIQK